MRVLIGDDQPDVLQAARLVLKGGGHESVLAGTPQAVLDEASRQRFDVLLLDMNYARDTTSGREGMDLMRRLRTSGVNTPVVLMTAWGSIDLAVEAIRRGASDFVEKPWHNDRLLQAIDRFGAEGRHDTMRMAKQVQQRLLGRVIKQLPGLDYAGSSVPAGPVGGDYFDFLDAGTDKLGVILADVSGKGVGAALLMAHLQAAVRSRPHLYNEPAKLVAELNTVFWDCSPSEQYATLFYCVYDANVRSLCYANAGHPAALLLRRGCSSVQIESTGMPVGMFPNWRGEEVVLPLKELDCVALVSDGVLESGSGEDFGHAGLLLALQRAARKDAAGAVEQILSDAGAAGTVDDTTAVVLQFA